MMEGGSYAGSGQGAYEVDELGKRRQEQEQIPIAHPVQQGYGYGYAGANPGPYSQTQSADDYLMQGQNVDDIPYAYIDEMDDILRMGFIRKVFLLLAMQLFVTFGCIITSVYTSSIKTFLQDPDASGWFVGLGFFLLITSTCALSCCSHLTRQHPHNLILLSVYTIAQSMLLSVITVAYDVQAVMIACGATAAVVVGLVAFASQTKYDFTGMGVYLYVALWTLLLFGFIAAFSNSEGMQTAYAALGTLLFSFYLVYDVQLIIGGNHKMRFSIDDYVMAALMLYIDIIQLFMYILRLVAQSRDN